MISKIIIQHAMRQSVLHILAKEIGCPLKPQHFNATADTDSVKTSGLAILITN